MQWLCNIANNKFGKDAAKLIGESEWVNLRYINLSLDYFRQVEWK